MVATQAFSPFFYFFRFYMRLVCSGGVSGGGAVLVCSLPIALITVIQNAFTFFHTAYDLACFGIGEDVSIAQVVSNSINLDDFVFVIHCIRILLY